MLVRDEFRNALGGVGWKKTGDMFRKLASLRGITQQPSDRMNKKFGSACFLRQYKRPAALLDIRSVMHLRRRWKRNENGGFFERG